MTIVFPDLFRKTSLKLFEELDTPVSLSSWLLLKNHEYGQLAVRKVDPGSYLDPESYYRDSVAVSWLRKCQGMDTGIDLSRAAYDAFEEAEKACALTNSRLAPFIHGGPFGQSDERIGGFLHSVKKVVSDILGPIPTDLVGRFGPGATFEDRGKWCTVPDKISSRPTVTRSAKVTTDPAFSRTLWSRSLVASHPYRSDPKIVRGNRFTSVPKDATKDRGIAIEPSINVYYQLGIGTHIRERLLRIGIDLRDGQSKHMQSACAASKPESFWSQDGLATIDLKSASDSVSTSLVRLLLPSDWHQLLDSLRSPTTVMPNGETWYLQKFSSMGNGFTFELETLIFLAVSLAVCGRDGSPGRNVLVYGDDIIVPIRHANSLIAVLRYLGFSPNREKTFVYSPFRESCGGDYFMGEDVRPHFVKSFPDEPQSWISIANGLRRVSKRLSALKSRVGVHLSWLSALSALPSTIRSLRGPADLGDIVIHDDDQDRWITRWDRNGIRWLRVWKPVGLYIPMFHWKPEIQLASAVYGVPSRGVTPRGGVSGYKHGWVAYS